MPKVVTGAGLREFIDSGKHETIEAKKPEAKKEEAPALEVKKEVVTDIQPETPKEEPKAENEEGLEAEDQNLSEIIRKKIGKKHRAMKEAQEEAADAEVFAKGQYERARLAEERASQLERELAEARKVTPPPAVEKEPDIKDFTDDKGQVKWTEYTKAVADYSAKKAVADDRKLRDEEALKQAQEREAADKAEAAKRFKEKADKIEGFAEKLSGSQVWFPNAVLEYITESDDGPEIVMHLIDNPETAERISKLRPIKAIAEIGKIVKGFGDKAAEKAPPAVVDRGGAPPPITPISGSGTGTINTDPAKMSFRELREFERARRKKH
jgi:hypothetical protein